MTTATLDHAAPAGPRDRYGFRTVAQMEWRKLRSVRSTWWTLARLRPPPWSSTSRTDPDRTQALGHDPRRRTGSLDPTNGSFATGPWPRPAGSPSASTGVLALTAEFTSRRDPRHVRRRLPRRPVVLATAEGDVDRSPPWPLVAGRSWPSSSFAVGQAAAASNAGPRTPPSASPGPCCSAVLMAGRLPGPDRADRPRPRRAHPAHGRRDLRAGRVRECCSYCRSS